MPWANYFDIIRVQNLLIHSSKLIGLLHYDNFSKITFIFQEKWRENRVLNQGKISHFFQKMILSQKESKFIKTLKTAKSAKLVKVRDFWTFAVSTILQVPTFNKNFSTIHPIHFCYRFRTARNHISHQNVIPAV